MTDALAIEPHALATETASGSGALVVDIGPQRTCLRLRLSVSALIGTSLIVYVQSGPTGTGPWEQIGTLPLASQAQTRDTILVNAREFVRVTWVLTGTSATFRVSGEAHTLFATPDDVSLYAFPAKTSDSLDSSTLASACLAATEEAATYLAGRFTFPILSWGQDVTMHVAKIAGYQIMARRGFQPQGADEIIVKGRDDAISYFKMISKNELYPSSIVDSDVPDEGNNDAYVVDAPVTQWDVIGGQSVDPTFGDPFARG